MTLNWNNKEESFLIKVIRVGLLMPICTVVVFIALAILGWLDIWDLITKGEMEEPGL